ncbi:hypothetical protein CLF_112210 [Clonorchis sinensis]|uniref:Uncharacterized protein n=1 Tax=Clonorchis sinensis TaxID=79923 RepID=G7YVZ3_CLOSI|nr:hypothetical protein CLF_112210 [Clonorchis sinensis]
MGHYTSEIRLQGRLTVKRQSQTRRRIVASHWSKQARCRKQCSGNEHLTAGGYRPKPNTASADRLAPPQSAAAYLFTRRRKPCISQRDALTDGQLLFSERIAIPKERQPAVLNQPQCAHKNEQDQGSLSESYLFTSAELPDRKMDTVTEKAKRGTLHSATRRNRNCPRGRQRVLTRSGGHPKCVPGQIICRRDNVQHMLYETQFEIQLAAPSVTEAEHAIRTRPWTDRIRKPMRSLQVNPRFRNYASNASGKLSTFENVVDSHFIYDALRLKGHNRCQCIVCLRNLNGGIGFSQRQSHVYHIAESLASSGFPQEKYLNRWLLASYRSSCQGKAYRLSDCGDRYGAVQKLKFKSLCGVRLAVRIGAISTSKLSFTPDFPTTVTPLFYWLLAYSQFVRTKQYSRGSALNAAKVAQSAVKLSMAQQSAPADCCTLNEDIIRQLYYVAYLRGSKLPKSLVTQSGHIKSGISVNGCTVAGYRCALLVKLVLRLLITTTTQLNASPDVRWNGVSLQTEKLGGPERLNKLKRRKMLEASQILRSTKTFSAVNCGGPIMCCACRNTIYRNNCCSPCLLRMTQTASGQRMTWQKGVKKKYLGVDAFHLRSLDPWRNNNGQCLLRRPDHRSTTDTTSRHSLLVLDTLDTIVPFGIPTTGPQWIQINRTTISDELSIHMPVILEYVC